MLKKYSIEELINSIYSDFFLTVRMCQRVKEIDVELLEFIGGVADHLHNFPNLNVQDKMFTEEFNRYVRHVETVLQESLPLETKILYSKQLEYMKEIFF